MAGVLGEVMAVKGTQKITKAGEPYEELRPGGRTASSGE
jgi:hypothetical protein